MLLEKTEKDRQIDSLTASVATLHEMVQQLLEAQPKGNTAQMMCIDESNDVVMFEETATVVKHRSNKKDNGPAKMSSLAAAASAMKKPDGARAANVNRYSSLTNEDDDPLDEDEMEKQAEKKHMADIAKIDAMLEQSGYSDPEHEIGPDTLDHSCFPDFDEYEVDRDVSMAIYDDLNSSIDRIQALQIRGAPEPPASKGTGSGL